MRRDAPQASVAACFSGRFAPGVPQDKGEAISRHLLRPIGAEAHVALTASVNDMADSSDPSNPEPEAEFEGRQHAAALLSLGRLQPLSSLSVSPSPSTRWFLKALESRPHWPQLLQSFRPLRPNRTRSVSDGPVPSCTRQSESAIRRGQAPYVCLARANVVVRPVQNSYLAPVVGSPSLHCLHEVHAMRRCIHQLGRHERGARGGVAYDRVLFSRLDHSWLADHPPLHVLDPRHVCKSSPRLGHPSNSDLRAAPRGRSNGSRPPPSPRDPRRPGLRDWRQ